MGLESLLTSTGVASEGLTESYLAAAHLKIEMKGLGRKCGEASLGCLKGLCGAGQGPWQPCLVDALGKCHSEGAVGPGALVQSFQ